MSSDVTSELRPTLSTTRVPNDRLMLDPAWLDVRSPPYEVFWS